MKVSEALELLADTDESYGQLRGRCSALEYQIKVAEALGYLGSTGTQGEKQACARTTQGYKDKINEYREAKIEMETLAAKRKTAELHIEVWRSQNANKRHGNI